MSADFIKIRGARRRNLRSIAVDIPHRAFTVVTGPSGSGKSTLLFDILGGEASRQIALFSGRRLSGPAGGTAALFSPAAAVSGLGFTLALSGFPRSGRLDSLGRYLQISDLLAILFSRSGRPYCPDCGAVLESTNRGAMLAELLKQLAAASTAAASELTVAARFFPQDRAAFADLRELFLAAGYTRVVSGSALLSLESPFLEFEAGQPFDLVIDRLLPEPKNFRRLEEVINLALSLAPDLLAFHGSGAEISMSLRPRCSGCGYSAEPLEPDDLRYWRRGSCPDCLGTGEKSKAVYAGDTVLKAACEQCGGSRLHRFASGVKLFEFKLGELSCADISRVSAFLKEAAGRKQELAAGAGSGLVLQELPALSRRLELLEDLGLGYLTLNRALSTLSSGEMQRVRIARFLAQPVTGVTYLLDEPAAGLHPRDCAGLIEAVRGLVKAGDTVAAIEHDQLIISAADHLIVLGPGGGPAGGSLIFAGPAQGFSAAAPAQPAAIDAVVPGHAGWISIERAALHNLQDAAARFPRGCLTAVVGVSGSGKTSFIRGCVVPLVQAGLEPPPGGRRRKGRKIRLNLTAAQLPKALGMVHGAGHFAAVVDLCGYTEKEMRRPRLRRQSGIVAGTLGVMAELRELYSRTVEARSNGYGPERFSYLNSRSNCPRCRGLGFDLPLLDPADSSGQSCGLCGGSRFNQQIEQVTFKAVSIGSALMLTIGQAAGLFQRVPKIFRLLNAAAELGLSYLVLGQPSSTLSTGEMQRLRLAAKLSRHIGVAGVKDSAEKLIVLDEPTLGLDPAEVLRLIGVLRRLAAAGHTVLVIEHNLQLIQAADWIVELGPGAGSAGGRITGSVAPREAGIAGLEIAKYLVTSES